MISYDKLLNIKEEDSILSFMNLPIGDTNDITKNSSFLTQNFPNPIAIKKKTKISLYQSTIFNLIIFLINIYRT